MRRQTFARKQKPQYTQNTLEYNLFHISQFLHLTFFLKKKKKKELCNISVWLEKQNWKEEGNA